jgi:TolB protein
MSFQTNSVYSKNISSRLAPLTARYAMGLALLSGVLALLALVVSQVLPHTGAVAFLSWRDGNPDIYILDITHGTLHNLTDNDAINGSFAFAPDGNRIAFESNKDGNTEIYMMSLECPGMLAGCGGIRQLTNNETDSRSPAWSPDGRQIAYVFDVSFADSDNDIYVMDVEREEARNLTNNLADDNSPAWSPDGSRIAFRSARNHLPTSNEYEIYIASADGSDLRRLVDHEFFVREFAWSPDGKYVLLIRDNPYSDEDVALVDSNGTDLQLFTYASAEAFLSPTWSPDGTHIALIGNTYGIPNTLLTFDREGNTFQRAAQDVRYASTLTWSPNGLFLFFTITAMPVSERTDEIGMVDLATGSVQQLTLLGGTSPVWWP